MTPGRFARRLLGPAFPAVGAVYRRVFVDMEKVADWIASELQEARRVLDIGGGDGFVVNLVLDRLPDLQVTMTDLSPSIGSFISPSNRSRVDLRAGTDHAAISEAHDAVMLTDVLHHVPAGERAEFLSAVAGTADRVRARSILFKDIEPSGVRAKLSVWADHHITGDRHVSPAPMAGVAFPGFVQATAAMIDHPNYCLRFNRERDAQG